MPNNEYLSTVGVPNCATGYEGSPSPASLQCEASGSWTTVIGCAKKGKTTFITVIIVSEIQLMHTIYYIFSTLFTKIRLLKII